MLYCSTSPQRYESSIDTDIKISASLKSPAHMRIAAMLSVPYSMSCRATDSPTRKQDPIVRWILLAKRLSSNDVNSTRPADWPIKRYNMAMGVSRPPEEPTKLLSLHLPKNYVFAVLHIDNQIYNVCRLNARCQHIRLNFKISKANRDEELIKNNNWCTRLYLVTYLGLWRHLVEVDRGGI